MSYEERFKGLLKLLSDAKRDKLEAVIVHDPHVLGDNFEEIVESLDQVAASGLLLKIVPPGERTRSGPANDRS